MPEEEAFLLFRSVLPNAPKTEVLIEFMELPPPPCCWDWRPLAVV